MERAAFPGKRKFSQILATTLWYFQNCRGIDPALFHGPTGLYSFKMLPSALRTFAINRQPVDNLSANKCRFKFSWAFGGFVRQWLSEPAPPPPPPTRMHEGPRAYSHFLGEGVFLAVESREDFPRKPGKGGVLAIASGNQYPR